MKPVFVEYVESGTFVGGEECTYDAGIEHGERCVVLKRLDFLLMREELAIAKSQIENTDATLEQVRAALKNNHAQEIAAKDAEIARLKAQLAGTFEGEEG